MRGKTWKLILATSALLAACSDSAPPAGEETPASAPTAEAAANAGNAGTMAPASPAAAEPAAAPAPATPPPAARDVAAAPPGAAPIPSPDAAPGAGPANPAAPAPAATTSAAGTPVYDVTCPPGAAAAERCQVDKVTYVGWRTFAAQCQVCHGGSALGSTFAPNLLDRFHAGVDHARFVDVVTNGFRGQVGAMPAWKGNPNVMPHVDAMYAYLKARADGVLPPGRPARKP